MHSAERAIDVVGLARAAGFDNVSIDLMMWLPGQDVAQWLETVTNAIDVDADHLSLYILEVYPHLPLKQEIDRPGWRRHRTTRPPTCTSRRWRASTRPVTSSTEISNVCRPGRESCHNLKYWTDGEWLGVGPGAHSTWGGERWRNIASTEDYVRRIVNDESVVAERRLLTSDERLGDALFTGLRLSRGVNINILSERYGVDIWHDSATGSRDTSTRVSCSGRMDSCD